MGIASLNAQTTRISGYIKDAETKEAIPFANIIFQGTAIGTTSDFDGKFFLETVKKVDSLKISFIGYKVKTIPVKKFQNQTLNILLDADRINLQEVVIKPGENPAHVLLRKVIANRRKNSNRDLEYYNYEVYNKVEFDINNVKFEGKRKKLMKGFEFVYNYIDSIERKPFLPVFISESISDFYYKKSPKNQSEYIKAVKVSGVENESVTKFMGDLYQRIDIYGNYVEAFQKSFVSPIGNSALDHYYMYLTDSSHIDGKWCYQLTFKPKQKQDLVFTGNMWIHDTTFAVKSFEINIAENANINFIRGFSASQEFELIDTVWMIGKERMVIDFNLTNNDESQGFYGRKTTSYDKIVINKPASDTVYNPVQSVTVDPLAKKKSKDYWDTVRHDSLTEQERKIYEMVDSIKNVPRFKTFQDILYTIFTGYYLADYLEIGPYFYGYSFNQVEGSRFRVGVRTSNKWSTRSMPEFYLAYGTRDQVFKYGLGFTRFIRKAPNRIKVGLNYKYDLEQLGLNPNALRQDNIMSTILSRRPLNELTLIESYSGYYDYEFFPGLNIKSTFTHRTLYPRGRLNYTNLNDFNVYQNINSITTSEFSIFTRFAFKEDFVEGEFDRISLGSKYPIIGIEGVFGFRDVFNSDYEYQKLNIYISGRLKTKPLGYAEYGIQLGKIFGNVPYPLLELHPGNRTYGFFQYSFNLMNFFEFASDEYVTAAWTHHFNGFFFDKFPLFRRLKWREVVSAKFAAGSVRNENLLTMQFPTGMTTLNQPYYEVGAGIENIFRIFRIDAIYRLTHLNNPNAQPFGIFGSVKFSF
jgi:hypothetical protein